MKRIFLKKNGEFHHFSTVTGLHHPIDERTFEIAAKAAMCVDPDIEAFDIRFDIRDGIETEVVPVFDRSEPHLTLKGFVEYGRIRFGLTEEQAEKIRVVIVEAIQARKGARP